MDVLKGIWAVLIGMLTVVILSLVTDKVLEMLGLFPSKGLFSWWMLAIALVYRCFYAAVGGYVTAFFAPANPMRYVTILGIIGLLVSIGGLVKGWGEPAFWYPVALVVTTFPCTWLGGRLKE